MKCLEIQICKECESPMSLLWVNLNQKINMCTNESCDFPFNQDNFEDYCETLPKDCHKLFHPEFKDSKPIECDKLLLSSEEKEKIIFQCQSLMKADPIPELPTIDLSEFNLPPLPETQKWESGLKFYLKPEPIPSEEMIFSEHEPSDSYLSDSHIFDRETSPGDDNPYFNMQNSGSPINSFSVVNSNLASAVMESASSKTVLETGLKSPKVLDAVEVSTTINRDNFSQNDFSFPSEFDCFVNLNYDETTNNNSVPINNIQETSFVNQTQGDNFLSFGINSNSNTTNETDFHLTDDFFPNLF